MIKNKDLITIISIHADPSMPPGVGEWGGTHTYMKELLMNVDSTPYKFVLITRKTYANQKNFETINDNCSIYRFELGEYGYFDKLELYGMHKQSKLQIKNIISKLPEKPVLIHSVYSNSGQVAMELAKEYNINFVHSVISNGRGRSKRGVKNKIALREIVEQQVYNEAYSILCVSDTERDDLIKYYNVEPKKIVVAGQYISDDYKYPSHNQFGFPRIQNLRNTISTDYLEPLNSNTPPNYYSNWWNKKAFTFVGRISENKGLDVIIKVWTRLYDKYTIYCPPLWVVGGQPIEIDKMRTAIIRSGYDLEKYENGLKLNWWGYLDTAGLSTLYLNSLALVTLSIYEPGGRVAVEALSEGLPVIASPNGFANDIIVDWKNGFLVEYNDEDLLFIRLEHFVKQPYLSNTMNINAKITAKALEDYCGFLQQHIKVYYNAINNKQFSPSPIFQKLNLLFNDNRHISTYPYYNTYLTNDDIANFLSEKKLKHEKIEPRSLSDSATSFFWRVTLTDTNKLFLKVPNNRINEYNYWQPINKSKLITSSSERFQSEIFASSLEGIEKILYYDSDKFIIAREYFEKDELQDELTLLTAYMNKLKLLHSNCINKAESLFNTINTAIDNQIDIYEIDRMYERHIKKIYKNNINTFRDYSLRVEIRRWRYNYDSLLASQKSQLIDNIISKLELQNFKEFGQPIVFAINGIDTRNCIISKGKAIFLDCEHINIAWCGQDYANLVITVLHAFRKEPSIEYFVQILTVLQNFGVNRTIVGTWLLLDCLKEFVAHSSKKLPLNPLFIKKTESLLSCRF